MSEFSIKCPTCGNENEAERTYCWVCYTAFKEKPKSWTPESKPKLPQDYVKDASDYDNRFNKWLTILGLAISFPVVFTLPFVISWFFPLVMLTVIGFGISSARTPEDMPFYKRVIAGFITGMVVLGAIIALGFITCMGILLFAGHL